MHGVKYSREITNLLFHLGRPSPMHDETKQTKYFGEVTCKIMELIQPSCVPIGLPMCDCPRQPMAPNITTILYPSYTWDMSTAVSQTFEEMPAAIIEE